MKHYYNRQLLVLLLFFFTTVTYSQNRSSFYHKIKKSDIGIKYNLIYKDKKGNIQSVSLCDNYLKGVIKLDSKGMPFIDFWTITNSLYSNDTNCINNNTELGTFEIDLKTREKLGDPTNYIIIPFRALTWGVGTTPFRYRPKNDYSASTISTNLGVSVNFGQTFGFSTISPRAINNYSLTIGPFFGVSSIDLKKSTVKDPTTWTTDRTNAAINYGINTIFARNNFGLVLSFGFDNNFGENSKEWSYQNKPWFGIGINTSLGIF